MSEFKDKEIDAFVARLMKNDPVKFLQYAMIVIGRDLLKGNVTNGEFSFESNLSEERRFKIEIKAEITEIK